MKTCSRSRGCIFLLAILVFESLLIGGGETLEEEEDENECEEYTMKLMPVPALKEIQYYSSYSNGNDLHIQIVLYHSSKSISCGDSIHELERYRLNYTISNKDKLLCEDNECQYVYKRLENGYYCCLMEFYDPNSGPCHSETVHLVYEEGRRMSTQSRTILICSIVGVSLLVIAMTVIAFLYLNRRSPAPAPPLPADQQVNIPLVEMPPRSPRSGRMFILYHNDDKSHYNLVRTLARIFEEHLHWEVTFEDENSPNVEIERGLQTWVTDRLLQSDKIVVISSVGALYQITTRYRRRRIPDNVGGGISNVFLVAWHLIVSNPVLVRNYNKLFQVRFENQNDNCWLPEIVPGRHFDLPNDFPNLISGILGVSPEDSSLCSQVQRRVAKSELYRSFCDAVRANAIQRVPVSSSDSEDSCWIRPGV